jgi:hypothetical protein
MKKETFDKLVTAARRDLPTLKTDAANASTHHALMPVVEKTIVIQSLIIRALVENEIESQAKIAPEARVASPTPPAPVVVKAVVTSPAVVPDPVLPDLEAPRAVVPPVAGLPPDVPFVPGATNAFVTPQGTKIVQPDGTVEEPALPPAQDVRVG